MEHLEPRQLFSGTPSIHPFKVHRPDPASTVMLERANNPNLPITANRTTWVIIHGVGAAPGSVRDLAAAVDKASAHDQVLVVDWSQLAATDNVNTAIDNTQIVADALAAKIKALGIPAKYMNLIGFSFGGLIASRLAADLHSRGGVNRLIALDPANATYDRGGQSYTPNSDFVRDSNYSIVFHAGPYISDGDKAADDSVLFTNVGSTFEERHAAVYNLFTKIMEANDTAAPDAVSRVFSLDRILDGRLPAWKKNAYSGAFEAEIAANPAPRLTITSLHYRDGHTQRTVTIPV